MGLGASELAAALMLMFLGFVVIQAMVVQSSAGRSAERPASENSVQLSEPQAEMKPTPRQYLRIALLNQGLAQLPLVMLLGVRCAARRDGWRTVGVVPRRAWREAAGGVVGLGVALPMALGLSVVVTHFGQVVLRSPAPEIGHDLLEILFQPAELWVRIGLLASAVVVAPVLEELIFRGLVQTALGEILGWERRWLVVLIASGVFAAVHIGQPWQVLPSLFVLAVVMGWLYERSGSLLGPVLIHVGFNAINVALAGV